MTVAKVIIVEDDPQQAEMLKSLLTSLGNQVVAVCATGEQALVAAATTPADLYLISAALPGASDGVASARKLREVRPAATLLLGKSFDDETLRRVIAAEVDGCLEQPASVQSLRAAIALAADKFSTTARLQQATELLRAANLSLASRHEVAGFCRQITRDLMHLTHARYGAFGIFDEWGAPKEFIAEGINEEAVASIATAPCGEVLLKAVFRGAGTVNIADMATHPESGGLPPGHPPMRSLLGRPVIIHGVARGAIYLTDKNGGEPFTHSDERLLNIYAAEAGHALERDSLLQDLRQRNEQVLLREARLRAQNHALAELAARQNLDLSDLQANAALLTQRAAEVLEIERVSIWSYDADRKELLCSSLYTRSNQTHSSGATLKAENHPAYFTALDREAAIAADDASTNPATRELKDDYLTRLGIGAMLAVPIRLRGSVVSVLCLEHVGSARPWSADDESFARALSEIISAMYLASERNIIYKKLEEAHQQLLQSEKMASLGQLAAGVAHEINNPVGYVSSNLKTLLGYINNILELMDAYAKAEPELAPESSKQLQKIKQRVEIDYVRQDLLDLLKESQEGLARVRQIVQDLKEFSHVGEAEWQFADLNQGLDSTLNIVRNEIKYKAEVIKEYGDLPPVECIPSQLNQVFMNIMVNGAHAIAERGTITLRTGHSGEDWVWVEISDTGCGIPPEHLKRIFDPFFTTKPVGKGTGLGLSLSYSIIERHKGHIAVESELGKGTVFTIRLPVHRDVTTA